MLIVKILKKGQGFPGVRYNTGKVEQNEGELLVVRNFQALEGMGPLKPSDYVKYLKAVANRNHLIKSPQFHAVISCKEKEKNKHELAETAEQWLREMGYGDNPYMLIFHKDTKNNHIHMVTCRVNKKGLLIDKGFTYIRGIKILNQITGLNERLMADNDLERALSYQFSSADQFILILRSLGYSCVQKDSGIAIYRFGRRMSDVTHAAVRERTDAYRFDSARAHNIKTSIHIQKNVFSAAINKKTSFYLLKPRTPYFTSRLAQELFQKSGLQFFFTNKSGRGVYDYTIIDHVSGSVFSSSQIMPLSALVAPPQMTTQANIGSEQETGRAAGLSFQLNIAEDVDDEAVFGRMRNGKKNMLQEYTR